MKFVLAFDSFKGSITSAEAADAASSGIKSVLPDAHVESISMADGGEGLVSSIYNMLRGKRIKTTVNSPLMTPVTAEWLLLNDNTAVIEMAAASGLTLVPDSLKNPMNTTTYGTGELIKAAIEHGSRNIIVGIGGSATNDCGMGMAAALGVQFLDEECSLLEPIGRNMEKVSVIDLSHSLLNTYPDVKISVACDVTNPLYGPQGAAYIYGPQKGASSKDVEKLDKGLRNMARVIMQQTGIDINIPGAGAAGGLGAGFIAFAGGKLQPGIELILDLANFDAMIADADYIFTGEGKTDGQTLSGKVPMGIGLRTKKAGIPVICVSGCVEPSALQLREHGITALFSIANGPISLEDSIQNAAELLRIQAENITALIAAAHNAKPLQ